jgi:hypothetical protein
MSKNKFLHFSVTTAVALLLASPALANCPQPTGVYVGGGGGQVTLPGSVPAGGQVESWYLQLPTKTVVGRMRLQVQTPPQPGVPTSAFGFYSVNDLVILPVGSVGAYPITWDADLCAGTLTINFNPVVTWVDQSGNKKTQSYLGGADKVYNITIADNGSTLVLALDPSSLASQFQPTALAFPAFVPGYNIRLQKQ